MGTLGHQLTGKIEFNDTQNNLYGFYDIGNVKRKTQDYFAGQITKNGEKVCEVYGNYMGYMDIDKRRYFDTRESTSVYTAPIPKGQAALESDSTKRIDSIALATGKMEDAQKRKEELEES